MAGAVVGAIIAVTDLIFSAKPIFDSLFAPPEDFTHTVRVTFGSNATLDASLGGNVPGVALWDEFGRSIGATKSAGKKAEQGNFRDISIVANDKVGNIVPAYLSITAGGIDAPCIFVVSVTAADGSKFTWGAETAKNCGETAFFISNNLAGPGYAPNCVFIDRDHSQGIKHEGIGIHLDDFLPDEAQIKAYTDDPRLLCKSGPRFRLYEKLSINDPILVFDPPLQNFENRTDKDSGRIIEAPGRLSEKTTFTRKRGTLGSNTPWYDTSNNASTTLGESTTIPDKPIWKWQGEVIVTHMTSHNATELCASEMSWGPDVAAVHEGKFCSMQDKTLYDICTDDTPTCCFDVDQRQLRFCSSSLFGIKSAVSDEAATSYDRVHEWFEQD